MFQRIKRSVGELASKVTQQTQERPAVEIFKRLWHNVREEHQRLVQSPGIDLDDPALLPRLTLLEDLDSMVSLLIREDLGLIKDSNSGPGGNRGFRELPDGGFSHGPLKACLEYMLENRVFSDLCAMGLADRPNGMMSHILITIHRIVDKLRHPLLPYKTAHQPLCQLIRVAAEVGTPAARERLMALLTTLWTKMRHDPSQLSFFYSPGTSTRHEQLDMFLALLPFVLDSSEAGDKARYAVLCVSSICDAHLLDYVAHHTTFCKTLTDGMDRAFAAAMDARAARSGPISARALETAEEDLALCWRFANALSIPGVTVGLTLEDAEEAARSAGCDADGGAPSAPGALGSKSENAAAFAVLSNAVVKAVHKDFFVATLLPALLETNETQAASAMTAVCSMLKTMAESGHALQSQLLWSLVSLLIDTRLEPDTRTVDELNEAAASDDNPVAKLHTTLLMRIDSMAPMLSTAALKLFAALIDLDDPRVLHSLVMRQLYPGNHLAADQPGAAGPTQFDAAAACATTGDDPKAFVTPIKTTLDAADEASGELRGGEAVEFLKKYPGSPKPPSMNSVKRRRNVSWQEQSELIAFEAYLTDGQGVAAAKIAAFSSFLSVVRANQTSPVKSRRQPGGPAAAVAEPRELETLRGMVGKEAFHEGLFLALTLNKLERLLDSTLEENLVLTGILARLAQFPHRILHTYLFDEPIMAEEFWAGRNGRAIGVGDPWDTLNSASRAGHRLYPREGLRSLAGTLAIVWKEAMERIEDLMPDFEGMRTTVRQDLGVDEVDVPDIPSPPLSPRGQLSFESDMPLIRPPPHAIEVPPGKLGFVQAQVVLEEFLKELASILQAKQNLLELQCDLADPVAEV